MSASPDSTQARDKLGEILTHYGRAVLDDPRRCEALLRDLLPDHRREVHLLVSALRERVPADLLASNNGIPPSLLVDQLAQRLHDHLGMAPAFAQWAVETWAVALGVMALPPPKRARTPKGAATAKAAPPAPVASQPKAKQATTKAAPARTRVAQGGAAKTGGSKRPPAPSPPPSHA